MTFTPRGITYASPRLRQQARYAVFLFAIEMQLWQFAQDRKAARGIAQ